VALIEGKEAGRGARQPGGHQHRLGIDGEVGEHTPLELEERLVRVAVLPVGVSTVDEDERSKIVSHREAAKLFRVEVAVVVVEDHAAAHDQDTQVI
jgi:hypothetical protein